MKTTKRLTKEEFIRRASVIHSGKYDYSNVVYVNGKSKVVIKCPLHGVFTQRPYNHAIGEGCPKCRLDYMRKILSSNVEEFITNAKKVHNDRYDYSKAFYFGNKKSVEIICSKHGAFWQSPNNHLRGAGCPECSQIIIANKNRKTREEFIEDAEKIHGDKYDYSQVEYHYNQNSNVIIVCKKHGKFSQIPHNHLCGSGCPKCISSKGEQKIMMFLNSEGVQYECQKRFIDCRSPKGRMLRFDFYIPEKKMLIEYDGPQHYGHLRIGKYTLKKNEYERLQVHDQIKNDYVKSRGIDLLRIPYWDVDIKTTLSKYL